MYVKLKCGCVVDDAVLDTVHQADGKHYPIGTGPRTFCVRCDLFRPCLCDKAPGLAHWPTMTAPFARAGKNPGEVLISAAKCPLCGHDDGVTRPFAVTIMGVRPPFPIRRRGKSISKDAVQRAHKALKCFVCNGRFHRALPGTPAKFTMGEFRDDSIYEVLII
mgnify:CR=1 FL=1